MAVLMDLSHVGLGCPHLTEAHACPTQAPQIHAPHHCSLRPPRCAYLTMLTPSPVGAPKYMLLTTLTPGPVGVLPSGKVTIPDLPT